jgi:type II secretory ATPase GspE/PulE/Tfp pilus assembly ATPase PilB-like protein
VAIHEILENSEEMHHLIITRATSHALRQKAIEQGMVTFTTAAGSLAMAGRISAEEAARAASQVRALLPKDATRAPKPSGS